jgi:hypothetical protein
MPSEKSIVQKLQIKPGRKVLFVNPPEGYLASMGELPTSVTILEAPTRPTDIIQLFVKDRQELERHLPVLKETLAHNGMIWITYTKGTSKIKTDINRDTINAYAHTLGLEGVSMISIDDNWSALRVKSMDEK